MILIDTDIFIDYLKDIPLSVVFFEEKMEEISYSIFTQMELLIGCRNKKELKVIDDFLKQFNKIETSEKILNQAV